ncbi:hypothetical protein CR983_02855 [Candidatus Saccharibacteria bacterium]|nr:MAG: hypothetical protein CR983_02855 [Candidatus Saccharibacteria bacterium]
MERYGDRHNKSPDNKQAAAADQPGGDKQPSVDQQEAAGDSPSRGFRNKWRPPSAKSAPIKTGNAAVDTGLAVLARFRGKKGGATASIVGLVLGIMFMMTTLFGPSALIVHVKEVITERFSSYATAVDARQTFILKKRLKDAVNPGCKINIRCRFKGLSGSTIRRMEKNGFKLEKGRTVLGRTTVKSIETPSGVKFNAKNYSEAISNNPVARRELMRMFSPRYMATIDPAFNFFARKMGIDKTQKIKGSKPDEIDENFKRSIAGVDESGEKIGRRSATERDGKYFDEDGKEISKDEYDRIKKTNADFDETVKRVKNSGKKAAIGAGKAAALTAVTAGMGAVDAICTGYYVIQAVGFGAKALVALQLARYYTALVANPADFIKIGTTDTAMTTYVGNKLTAHNKYGESFTESFGYRYAAYGDTGIGKPKDSSTNIDNYRANTMQFSLGGGLGGAIRNFTSQLNKYTGGTPKKVCKLVKNPFTQIGMLIGGLAITFFSGGTSLGPGIAASVAVSAALSAVIAVAIPILQNIIAGKLVTATTLGADAGNASIAGAGAVDANLSQSHGLQPLKKDNVQEFTRRLASFNHDYRLAQREVANPFDVNNPFSPANTVVASLAMTMPNNIGQLVTSPASVLKRTFGSIGSTPAFAAEDEMAQYKICKDADYVNAGYAADPFCNIRYGLTNAELARDPETVDAYMYDNGHISEEGEPKGEEFNKYIDDCIQRTRPLLDEGDEGNQDNGEKCSNNELKYQNFRLYYLDTVVVDALDGTDTFQIGGISDSSGSSSGGSAELVSGSDQELAQQILDSGNVTGDSRYMKQIRDYAAGNASCHINSKLLQIMATLAKTHKYSVSSLNRYCTGVLTASGRASYHYANKGGHAVDFNYVDGVHSNGGANQTDATLLKNLIKLLPSGSGIGQVNCRGSRWKLSLPSGISEFNDSCNHIHFQVPQD